MRKMMIFVTLFVCSFFLMYNVSAASYTARAYINSSCNVRTGPGTQNTKISSALPAFAKMTPDAAVSTR